MKSDNTDKGRMFVHTPKAIKRGEPADRVFVVVKRWEDDPSYFVAWKVTKVPGGFEHPAFPDQKLLSPLELKLKGSILKGSNGSKPTAIFRPDSLYAEIWA